MWLGQEDPGVRVKVLALKNLYNVIILLKEPVNLTSVNILLNSMFTKIKQSFTCELQLMHLVVCGKQ